MANMDLADMEALSDDEAPPLLISKSDQEVAEQEYPISKKVPITIITEFGDSADIEKSLTVNKDGREVEEWISLANGCICCSVKDSGVAAIESLMERQGAFDYILLETTGLADPGNIAPIFWVDDGLGSSIYLDGIVTVVDAKNVLRNLDQPASEENVKSLESPQKSDNDLSAPASCLTTAHLQISHSDILILNKTDLVTPAELEDLTVRIRSINGMAKLILTTHSKIAQLEGTILDLHAYDSFQTTNESSQPSAALPFEAKGSSKLDPTISTRTFPLPILKSQDLAKLDEWLRKVLWRDGESEIVQGRVAEVHRTKGVVPLTDGSVKVIQGVREIFDIMEGNNEETMTEGKIVMIGRNLDVLSPPVL